MKQIRNAEFDASIKSRLINRLFFIGGELGELLLQHVKTLLSCFHHL
jgi:hypothetical protein